MQRLNRSRELQQIVVKEKDPAKLAEAVRELEALVMRKPNPPDARNITR